MRNIESLDSEKKLETCIEVLLIIGALCSVVLLFIGFIDDTNWFIIGSSVGILLISIAYYFFVKVIVEISKSIKNRNTDNVEILLREIIEKIGKNQSSQLQPKAVLNENRTKPYDYKTDIIKDKNEVEQANIEKNNKPKKVNPIDTECDDFKRKIHKWKAIKDKGYIDQAIKEYQEYTGLDYDEAVGFINEL